MKFSIKANPYSLKIHFIISKDKEEVKAFGKRFNVDISDEDMEGQAAVFSNEKSSPIVWLQEIPETPKGYGVFFHEVHHACRHVGEYVEMKAEELAGETFTYFIESIIVKSLTKIKKLCLPSQSEK